MPALVGGAFLCSFLSVLFDRMASRPVADFISGKEITRGLLQKLKYKLLLINEVLDDAEEKQIRSPTVRKWLDELKDVVYVAGELLDEINTEALQHKLEDDQTGYGSTSYHLAKNFIYHLAKNFIPSTWFNKFDKALERNIVDILERLEVILDEKAFLGLKEGVPLRPQARIFETTSPAYETVVYGRDNDKEVIIQLLLSDDATENMIGVIPIVGVAGIGKTTLAQLVYNNDKVKQNFEYGAWVCVSDEFDVLRITREIYESITSTECDITELDLLQVKLNQVLTDKKFLIVLDDVWNQKYSFWEILKRSFVCGARGSKVIVTTRNSDIASMICTLPPHYVMPISEEDCWSLFSEHVSANVYGAYPNLEVIGRQIVRKCGGHPLAVKSLGGLLQYEVKVKEWENILESDIWELIAKENRILPALWLSYYYLPSHLKRCFAYCSIFPKDFVFRRSDLVLLWMAEDLIQPTRQTRIEEVGEDYFDKLMSRSFFQPLIINNEPCAIMHDLINDLAKFVSGEFCMRLEDNEKIGSKTRHFSYIKGSGHHDFAQFEALREAKYLHTFLPLRSPTPYFIPTGSLHQVLHDLLPMFQCLRVLNLSGYHISELQISIGNLKHLRHLNLSRTKIKELPDSVCTLYNLQTLLLCHNYTLKQLPRKLGRLINLRHLDIDKTSILKMPLNMGKLIDLQLLPKFVLDKGTGHNIVELKKIKHLHGKLHISGLDNIVGASDALEANMKDKKYLDELVLRWGGDEEDTGKDREVLVNLQPHANLKKLEIVCYGGTTFPNWFGDSSCSNLVSVKLVNCKFCWLLPALGHLPSLKDLCIRGLKEVVSIGREFYGNNSKGSGIQPFRSLEELRFEDMAELREWSCVAGDEEEIEEEGGIFPSLCELTLTNCPKLTEIVPLDKLVKLERLRLENLQLYSGSLSDVESKCPKFPSLCTLEIWSCPKFVCFPNGGMDAPNLKQMFIWECEEVRSLPEEMHTLLPSLERLYVIGSPKLEGFPQGGFPSKLEFLQFDCSRQVFASPGQWGLQRLQNLRELVIEFTQECGEDDQVDNYSFLEDGLLPTSLTSLKICNLPSRTTIQGKELRKLISLESLTIVGCPDLKLKSCLEGVFPSKLEKLAFNCSRQVFASRGQWDLQRLESLRDLRINFTGECGEEVDSFPEEGLLPTSLTYLYISNLPKHMTLQGKELRKLISLEHFTISECPELQCLPEWLPTSLSQLNISQCPLLAPRVQRETGEDWPKVARIPHINVDVHPI